MNIFIEYCVAWNYLPHASRVEAELKANYPESKITLVKGSGGIFDVKCDDRLIFSKHKIKGQRIPNEGEIVSLIKADMAR